eukprot:m.311603 g.311603  ORF g.311603 m.311603 type:complete len:355 (+) comp20228_c0_seq2:997-2061(+)
MCCAMLCLGDALYVWLLLWGEDHTKARTPRSASSLSNICWRIANDGTQNYGRSTKSTHFTSKRRRKARRSPLCMRISTACAQSCGSTWSGSRRKAPRGQRAQRTTERCRRRQPWTRRWRRPSGSMHMSGSGWRISTNTKWQSSASPWPLNCGICARVIWIWGASLGIKTLKSPSSMDSCKPSASSIRTRCVRLWSATDSLQKVKRLSLKAANIRDPRRASAHWSGRWRCTRQNAWPSRPRWLRWKCSSRHFMPLVRMPSTHPRLPLLPPPRPRPNRLVALRSPLVPALPASDGASERVHTCSPIERQTRCSSMHALAHQSLRSGRMMSVHRPRNRQTTATTSLPVVLETMKPHS